MSISSNVDQIFEISNAQFEFIRIKEKSCCFICNVEHFIYILMFDFTHCFTFNQSQARHIQVSTDDSEVKANLRQLGEPICECFE